MFGKRRLRSGLTPPLARNICGQLTNTIYVEVLREKVPARVATWYDMASKSRIEEERTCLVGR
jgi:hypothetical protein